MTLPMTRRLLVPLAALIVGGAAGCVDLKETPITGITSAYYNTPGGFEAAVNAMYTPARTHWPLERGATMTVFGTDEYRRAPTAATSSSTTYTAQLNGDVDFIRDTWTGFLPGDQHGEHGDRRGEDRERPMRRRTFASPRRSSCERCTSSRSSAPTVTFRSRSCRRPGVVTETTREPVGEGVRRDHRGLTRRPKRCCRTRRRSTVARTSQRRSTSWVRCTSPAPAAMAPSPLPSPDFALAAAQFQAVVDNSRFGLVPSTRTLWTSRTRGTRKSSGRSSSPAIRYQRRRNREQAAPVLRGTRTISSRA